VLPPLATRATLAAWPASRVDDLSHSGPTLYGTDTVQANNQGKSLCSRLGCTNVCVRKGVYTYDVTNLSLSMLDSDHICSLCMCFTAGTGHRISGTGNNLTTEDTSRMSAQNATSNSIPHMVSNVEQTNIDMRRQQGASITTEYTSRMGAQNANSNSIPRIVSNTERTNIDMLRQQGASITTEYTSRMGAQNSTSNSIPHMVSNTEQTNIDMRRQQGASITTEYTSRMGAQNANSNSIPRMVSNTERTNIDMLRQQGASVTTEYTSRMGAQNSTSNSIPHMVSNVERMNIDMQRQQGASITTEDALPMDAQNATSNLIPHMVSTVESMNIDMQRCTNPVSHNSSMANRTSSIAEEMHIDTANITMENSVYNQSSHMNSNVAVAHEDTIHVTRDSSVTAVCSSVSENLETERGRVPVITDNTSLNGSASNVFNNEDILMDDASDNPLILSVDQEVPFTYLASLSAKWAAMKETDPLVRGKIKVRRLNCPMFFLWIVIFSSRAYVRIGIQINFTDSS